jgi:hypothetical protein
MGWIGVLCSDLIYRKVSFQGPQLVIQLISQRWDPYSGTIPRGFLASKEAPLLSEAVAVENKMEAKSMTGTDESV